MEGNPETEARHVDLEQPNPLLEPHPQRGFWSSTQQLVHSIVRAIYFIVLLFGVLLLSSIIGLVISPITCLIIGIGNSFVILGLWPVHIIWTCYCVLRTKLLGPILKGAVLVGASFLVLIWPVPGVLGSFLFGACLGFFWPIVTALSALEIEDREIPNCATVCFHVIWTLKQEGTWSPIKSSFSAVKSFAKHLYDTYFSIMKEFCQLDPPNGVPYEIRLFRLFGCFVIGLLGIVVDVPLITIMALYKSPIMLFKGWRDIIRQVLLMETCSLFYAATAVFGIPLWPVAVVVAVLGSFICAYPLGGYGAVICYKGSITDGLCYIISSLANYDEFTNSLLGLGEGTCFPKLQYAP